MILTLTPNTTIDQTVFVANFIKNKTMRATQTVQSMGGKPTDAAWILGEIGVTSKSLGFAAGPLGEKVRQMLAERGVTTDFIEVGGQTRLNMIIIDSDDHTHTTITTASLKVTPQDVEALIKKYGEALPEASVVVLGGTLPPGMAPSFYTETIRMARERNVPTIFDATDANLRAGLEASPTYIKPNRDELADFTGLPVDNLANIYKAGRMILEKYGTCPIVTLAEDGALAVLPDRAWHIPPIKVDVVSPAGAGDAVLAGLAASIFRKQPIEEGLRLGVAAATAVCLKAGTADCDRADVERFLPQVQLIPYSV